MSKIKKVHKVLDFQWDELYKSAYVDNEKNNLRIKGLKRRQQLNESLLKYIDLNIASQEFSNILILGGGYEFPNLKGVFPKSKFVITDLSPRALKLFEKYTDLDKNSFSCFNWDASMIPKTYNEEFIKAQGEKEFIDLNILIETFDEYFKGVPILDNWPFPDNNFDFIVAPVILESLPFGVISALLNENFELVLKNNLEADLSNLSSCLGEEFYYLKSLRILFERIIINFFKEAKRCLSNKGVLYTSLWLRKDELQPNFENNQKQLLRIGDIRVLADFWDEIILQQEILIHNKIRIYGQYKPSIFNQFVSIYNHYE